MCSFGRGSTVGYSVTLLSAPRLSKENFRVANQISGNFEELRYEEALEEELSVDRWLHRLD